MLFDILPLGQQPSLRRVCRKWNRLVNQSLKSRKTVIACKRGDDTPGDCSDRYVIQSDEALNVVLPMHPQAETFKLINITIPEGAFENTLPTKLKHFHLEKCSFLGNWHFLRQLPDLKSLTLTTINIDDNGVLAIARNLPQLESFTIMFNSQITGHYFGEFGVKLKTLCLSNCTLLNPAFLKSALIQFIERGGQLENFDLRGQEFRTTFMNLNIFQIFQTSLIVLKVNQTQLYLLETIELPNLKELVIEDLTQNEYLNYGELDWPLNLSTPKLELLSMTHHYISDSLFNRFIFTIPHLKMLKLSRMPALTKRSLTNLELFKHLVKIDMNSIAIDDDIAIKLVERNLGLRDLTISYEDDTKVKPYLLTPLFLLKLVDIFEGNEYHPQLDVKILYSLLHVQPKRTYFDNLSVEISKSRRIGPNISFFPSALQYQFNQFIQR